MGHTARMTLDRIIADIPRWMFLLILVYAPLAFGCTRPVAVVVLNQFAAVLVVFWLVSCGWRRRWPRLPWVPVVLVALLLLEGWWMAWNAHSVHRYMTWTTVLRLPADPPLPGWPGAIDRDLSRLAMLNITALLGLFLFACDLMTRPVWRKRVWITIAFTALAVALLGTVMKLGGPPAREWLWDKEVAKVPTTFATYRYHGNAASLMSIGWALVLGGALVASQRPQPLVRAGWVLALMGLLLGLFLNTSRSGWVLAVLMVGLVGGRFAWPWWRTVREQMDWRRGLLQFAVVVAVAGTLVAVGLSADWKDKLARINVSAALLEARYPSQVYHHLARDTGFLGHGPDCFCVALPPYMERFGMSNESFGFWRHAHNDYYEYLFNWGWGGLALWSALVLGGVACGLRDHFRSPIRWGSTQWVQGFCGCVAMLGILLQARWDFPLEKASIFFYFLTLLADGWATHENVEEGPAPDEPTGA